MLVCTCMCVCARVCLCVCILCVHTLCLYMYVCVLCKSMCVSVYLCACVLYILFMYLSIYLSIYLFMLSIYIHVYRILFCWPFIFHIILPVLLTLLYKHILNMWLVRKSLLVLFNASLPSPHGHLMSLCYHWSTANPLFSILRLPHVHFVFKLACHTYLCIQSQWSQRLSHGDHMFI